MPPDLPNRQRAEQRVLEFTLAASATGAIPVPAASVAVVAENAALINAVAAAMGVEVTVQSIVASMPLAQGVNLMGRAVFLEGARMLGWFAGPFGVAGISALGAATAGLQTWLVGQLTIAVCENRGRPLAPRLAQEVVGEAQRRYEDMRERRR